jgi:Zn-dependent metalloprotease
VALHSNRFGFGPGQALVSGAVFHDRTGSAIRFNRTYRGLSVIGGDFIVHLTPSGAYRYGNGMRIGGLPTSLTATVSSSAAGATAAAALHYRVASTSSRLVIYGGRLASPLAWQINTKGTSGAKATVTYVSATTGRILARWSTVDTALDVGKGRTEYSGTVKVNDLKSGGIFTLQDNTRGNQQTYNANHSTSHGWERSSRTRTTSGAITSRRTSRPRLRTLPTASPRPGTSTSTRTVATASATTALPLVGSSTGARTT